MKKSFNLLIAKFSQSRVEPAVILYFRNVAEKDPERVQFVNAVAPENRGPIGVGPNYPNGVE